MGRFGPRRLVAVLTAACAGAALAASGGAVRAAEDDGGADFQEGTASAIAHSYRVNPSSSGLSLGVAFGLSLADYTNTVARAESRAIDLGVIGTTLAARNCDGSPPDLRREDQPQRLFVDSRDEGAAAGRTEQERYAPVITKHARATDAPEGEAVTTTAPLDVPGIVQVAGARSRTLVRVVDGSTREALATADIAELRLGGGAAVIEDLRWEARHRTGAVDEPVLSFTVGHLMLGGKPTPVPADLDGLATTLNRALKPLGIRLTPPALRRTADVVFVDPLMISVVPASERDAVLFPLLEAAYPVRKAVTDAVLEQSCTYGTYITVADVAVGSLTGAGSFSLELGGVQASSRPLQPSSFLGGSGRLGGVTPDLPAATGPAGAPPAAALSAGAPPEAPADVAPAGSRGGAAPALVGWVTGSRGGRLALVSGAVLGLLALLAEADRRAMRRGRTIQTERR